MSLSTSVWIRFLAIFSVAAVCVQAASVKPFVFENEDSDDATQQKTWDELVKYKLWGTEGIELTNEGELRIEETSGYNGTATGDLQLAHDHHLGGPILVGKDVNFIDFLNVELLKGPMRVLGNIKVPSWRTNELENARFDGPYCVQGTVYGKGADNDPIETNFKKMVSGGTYIGSENPGYGDCPNSEVPSVDVNMNVPNVDFDTVSHWDDSLKIGSMSYPVGEDTKIAYIHVPPDSVYTNDYGTYDKFIEDIYVSAVPSFRIYVLMPPGGRLTRIFVRDGLDIDNSAHNPKIQVVYVPEGTKFDKDAYEWDLTDADDFNYATAYRGNLLFYTKEKIDWGSTDAPEYQGTFMTTDTMDIGNSFSISGQLIAKYIKIRTPYTGNFKYVPFDPPTLDIDPEVLASNIFPENDLDSLVPIRLSETSLNNVDFNYCFDLDSDKGTVSIEDFKKTTLSKFYVCGEDTGYVEIVAGKLIPEGDNRVFINVVTDAYEENEETLILRVFNLGGAVLPGNLLEGYFALRIVDRSFPPATKDGEIVATEDVSRTFSASDFYYSSTAPTPLAQKSIIINGVPTVGTLTYKGNVVSLSGDKTSLRIPLDSIADLKYQAKSEEYGDAYATFVFAVEDVNNMVSENATMTINVTPVNDAPVAQNATFSVSENNEDGAKLTGSITVVDVDDKEFTYKFDSTDPNYATIESLFEMDPSSGEVSVKSGVVLDYETMQSTYTVKVIVADKSASTGKTEDVQTATITATINIIDVNEVPVLGKDEFDADEHLDPGTVVGTVKGDDTDTVSTFTQNVFVAVGGHTDLFDIDSNGVITTKKELDYETMDTTYILVVKLVDKTNSSLYAVDTMTIHLNNVNENPYIVTESLKVTENPDSGTVVGTLEAKDDDFGDSVLTFTLENDPSGCFEVSESGTITVKKCSLDYENTKTVPLTIKVSDSHGGSSTKTVSVNVIDIPSSTIEITKAENTDTTWTKPDTIFTNLSDIKLYCSTNGAADVLCSDTTLHEGRNVIVEKVCNVEGFEGCAVDSVVVFLSTAAPTVTVSADPDAQKATNIYTIVEKQDSTDTNIYVNSTQNDILVTIKDSVSKKDTSFTVKLDLDTVSVPQKTYTALATVVEEGVALNENASNAVRTPVNGSEIKVSYTEKVAGIEVTVSYTTDNNGNVIKQAVTGEKGKVDSIEVITVSYEIEVNGKTVVVSYQADAVTGALLVKDSSGALMTQSAAGDSKSSLGSYTVSYDYVDKSGNSVTVTYIVDEKGNFVKNSEGNIGYEVSYTYVNQYGNSATQSVFIVLDQVGPKVEILSPAQGEIIRSNFVTVEWTVDGIVQDSLTLQALEKGPNVIVRYYRDKAGNEAYDSVIVMMKDSKDVEIAVEQPVTEISKEKVEEYYKDNPPADGQTFAVSIRNPSTYKEVETLIGGDFGTEDGSGEAPYAGLDGDSTATHLGPTLSLDVKLPVVNGVGGLATLDDLVGSDGMIALQGIDADSSDKITVEQYVSTYCEDVELTSDLSRINLYDTKLAAKIWVYTSLGNYVNYFHFTQELNDPDYTNDAGMLQIFFEQKPDLDGNVHAENGKQLGTGAYVYKVEAKIRSELRCTLPSEDYDSETKTFGSNAKKVGDIIKSDDELLKPFGYKRPVN